MDDYTPTTEEVRGSYGKWVGDPEWFDRWLAKHDAEVEARGLEKAADALTAEEYDPDDQLWEPVSGTYMHPSAWLRARAQQVRESGNSNPETHDSETGA